MIKNLTKQEFDQLPVANPAPGAKALLIEELEFYQNTATGRVGVITRDRTDKDYGYAVLALEKGKYVAVDHEVSLPSLADARAKLKGAL